MALRGSGRHVEVRIRRTGGSKRQIYMVAVLGNEHRWAASHRRIGSGSLHLALEAGLRTACEDRGQGFLRPVLET